LWFAWIGFGLGPFVAVALLKRRRTPAPLAASQQTLYAGTPGTVAGPPAAPSRGGSSMLSVQTLVTVAAVVAGIHGWIWLQTEQLHPCKAAGRGQSSTS
jgi:hypothetical protein